jgi:hypothetical protein
LPSEAILIAHALTGSTKCDVKRAPTRQLVERVLTVNRRQWDEEDTDLYGSASGLSDRSSGCARSPSARTTRACRGSRRSGSSSACPEAWEPMTIDLEALIGPPIE